MSIIFNHRHDVEVWFRFDVVDRLACVCIVGVGGVCGVVVVFECRFGVFWLVGGGFSCVICFYGVSLFCLCYNEKYRLQGR